jgi:hypothetical protein
MEDRKMRKRSWEAARWPWGWERRLTFGGGFGPVVRQNTVNE